MAHFVDGPVRLSVPATSANLGPGFDSLGLALDLRDELQAEVIPAGLSVEVTGVGADRVACDESHLVVRAMRAAFAQMGADPSGIALQCHNRIPHARGLGSSSAAIVAGIGLARALVAGGRLLMDDDAVLQLAAEIEGHPDNVAPALFGGFVICGEHDGSVLVAPSAVDPRISAVVFVPPDGVATEHARNLLPAQVLHREAAENAANAALLVASLAGRPELLLAATRDRLHQDYREPAMADSLALVRRLREDGHAATISGAGPSVLVLTDGPDLLERCPDGWQAHHLAIDHAGLRLVP